jgi:hypothetical protein
LSERLEEVWIQRAQQALDRIPGYRGYRLKDERRDADRRVRAAVADGFAGELARVERIGRDLANARRLGEIGDVERASQAIRHFIDRVRATPSGYGGLLGERDIDGVALDQLRLFDESLLLGVDELRPAVDALEDAAAKGQPLAPPANQIVTTIDSLLTRLDTRQQVITTGRAVGRGSVLAALQPVAAVVPPAAYSAEVGDAISILGDDHLVDARIAVDGQPRSFRLLRIARDPEEWLLVDRDPSQPMLRLTPVEPAERGAAIPGHDLRPQQAGTGDGEVKSDRRASALRPVRYAFLTGAGDASESGLILDWDGERQAFVGPQVEPLDVEVFRRTEAAG